MFAFYLNLGDVCDSLQVLEKNKVIPAVEVRLYEKVNYLVSNCMLS